MPQQFVIISAARSGSNYLASLLSSHPNVRCYGEVFGTLNQVWLRWLDWRYMAPRLWVHVLKCTALRKQWLGYKLMHDHCPSYMQTVLQDPAIKIIWLQRENSVERYVSFAKAMQTKVWRSSSKNASSKNEPLIIDTNRMLTKMRWVDASYKALIEQVVTTPNKSLHITYENLTERAPTETIAAIFTFLQLEGAPVASALRKQGNSDWRTMVQNSAEVVQALQGTEYQSLVKS